MTQANNPESNTFTYSYVDSNGVNRLALQSRTDPRNVSATYSYDAAGRTIGIGYNDGVTPSSTYSYDAAGRLTQSSTGYVTNNYTSFDSNGRVLKSNVQISGGTPYTFQYTYDLAGDLISETYPTGRVVNTTYDAAARPQTMAAQGAATPYVAQAGYWPSGAGYYWQYGNNVWPVEGYTAQLTPWYNNASLNNDGNSYLMALGTIWNANGVKSGTAHSNSWLLGKPGNPRLTSARRNGLRSRRPGEWLESHSLAAFPGVPGAFVARSSFRPTGLSSRLDTLHAFTPWLPFFNNRPTRRFRSL